MECYNGGTTTQYFILERGARQDNPFEIISFLKNI